ncbi:hypothetical protein, partial [Streptomyces sp. NRRL F-5065]|uniref:hypothetical protein n=1 Tax=Streptomyces sp. NRRL F-5065 TaxID=1463855 RepID=UPI0018FE4DEF
MPRGARIAGLGRLPGTGGHGRTRAIRHGLARTRTRTRTRTTRLPRTTSTTSTSTRTPTPTPTT